MSTLHYKNRDAKPLDGEVFLDCLGYDGIYSVSNFGRVRSERRGIIMRQQVVKSNPNNLKEKTKSLKVTFAVDKSRRTHSVAFLVGQAFLGDLKKNEVYSKKNKIWNDCRADNLLISSYSDCFKLAYQTGNNLRKKKHLTHNHNCAFIYTRHVDRKEFTGTELVNEYKRDVRGNIKKAINKGRMAYGSSWSRRDIYGR